MGSSKKHQLDGGGKESQGKKWAIAGISIRGPLKSIKTKQKMRECDDDDSDESTTPTAKESRIPERLACPAAPRKSRPVSTCHYNGDSRREFFTPPDLESVFIRHVERAN
ncbi:cyclin-dependent protein kinase inhibitor SMR6-like [Camellia sinensis]|uniref:cyclin-dependent protein kinase inhibitor SMR6-like n=1 Tax=Camellia sinensis TaxID=4442 RepID=UPI001035BA30|nr:cyclin-dependent protein kinase inhibitor SMR6-like [Camellia sinensis]